MRAKHMTEVGCPKNMQVEELGSELRYLSWRDTFRHYLS